MRERHHDAEVARDPHAGDDRRSFDF